MFGIEIPELMRFLMQAGAAVAGAASLWGYVFLRKSKKDAEQSRSFLELGRVAFWLFGAGLVIFLVGWFFAVFVFFPPEVFAHEGIAYELNKSEIIRGLTITFPFVVALLLIGFVFLGLGLSKREMFEKYGDKFFLIQFILISLFLALGIFSGSFGKEQLFHFFRNWHSILTLGTVVAIDALYIATIKKDNLKRALYPLFPIMSAVIWVGLGLDFIYSGSIVGLEGIRVTDQFLFNQAVVAIIILNGALLSGKINDLLISSIKTSYVQPLSKKMNMIFGVSGSVSIVSWLTITFISFFTLEISPIQMFGAYMTIVIVAFFMQALIKNFVLYKRM